MSWLLKISNWLSGGALDKYREEVRFAKARAQQAEMQLESLESKLKQAQKELTQANAQLQISQGFQVELGQTQIELEKLRGEHRSYRRKSRDAERQLEQLQTKLQQTTFELTKSQDWLKQINSPVKILEIKKLLPKNELSAFWGFGISSPQPETISVAGAIIVRGWVLGKRSSVELVKVIYREQTILEVAADNYSPTVVQQYPDIPQAANSGFEFPLAVAGLMPKAELSLVAVLTDSSVIPLCAIVLQ